MRPGVSIAQRVTLDRSQWQVLRERAGTGLAYSDILLEYFPSFQ